MTILRTAVTLAVATVTVPVFATNGTMPHGYGIKAQGMGGASIALPQDAVAAANNPAGMAFVPHRADIGLVWLNADRGTAFGGNNVDANGKENYFIPEFGYNRALNERMAVGVAVVGNGVGTRYDRPIGPPTNSNAGSELMQVVMSPTLSYKLGANHALGVSLNVAYQRLKIEGVEHTGLQNPGFDHSFGYGLGLGWTGKLSEQISVGATYTSKTQMGKLDRYRNLLAGAGEFDIPERYGVGIAVVPVSRLTVAADVLRVNWSKVKSIGNSLLSPGTFGAPDGPGFGWRDQNIYRIGASYAVNDALELRAGYSRGDQIIPSGETTLNYLAPVTPRNHITAGASWRLDKSMELSVVYTRAKDSKVIGTGPSAGVDPRHSQHWLGAAMGWIY